jgi:hypothetical protein
MKVPAERRAELHAAALKRIARSGENGHRQHLLAECLEAYAELDEAQRHKLQELLKTDQYEEARHLMITTYERAKMEGKLEERRAIALLLLGKKFGSLALAVQQRVEALSPEQLQQLLLDLVEGRSLKEMRLED